MASFEQFQAAINVHASIFQRPALQKLYLLFTEGTDAETSFVRTNRISHPQLWHSIDAGASAAIRSVREEFENTKTSKTLRKYLTDLQAGNNMTQLLFSCKGTHYPLNIASLTKPGKGLSPIEITQLYTKVLQVSNLTGSHPTMSGTKKHSTKKLSP